MRRVPGINIQYPWSQLLLSGKKTIETRFYPIPKKYLNVPLAVIETPGKKQNFRARTVGLIIFSSCSRYESESHFRNDAKKHLISKRADFDWRDGKAKWAWSVERVERLKEAKAAPRRRGIVWTISVEV